MEKAHIDCEGTRMRIPEALLSETAVKKGVVRFKKTVPFVVAAVSD